jgi:F-type H+-transporting ATPase subunit epsilon
LLLVMIMSSEKIHLEVVTPERRVLREDVDEVQLPGSNGYLGILPGHAPLMTQLQIGEVSYRKSQKSYYLAVGAGYCEVLPHKVTVLAEKAERGDEVDLERARTSKARAENRLADVHNADIDFARAEASLRRALARIHAYEKSQGTLR